jgi:hypothetical protein
MFIRKTTHTNKGNKKEYHTFKLIESVRTERGPRQRMLLNLGTGFTLAEERWKDLANRIEEIVTGQDTLWVYPEEVETLAIRYARKVIDYQGKPGKGEEKSADPDYQRVVDIDTSDNERSRSVRAEHVAYHILHTIRVTLRRQGINDSWTTIRKGLSTQVRITTPMKRDDGKIIHLRQSTQPEMFHKKIYDALDLPHQPGKKVKTIL